MEKLSELEDPRQPSNGTRHDFREILVIAVCAMLSDAAGDITAALDRLPRGATSISDLSEAVENAVERGWVYGSLMYRESHVRTGHLIVGALKTPSLRNALMAISRQFERIRGDTLTEDFEKIVAGSPEEALAANDGSGAAANLLKPVLARGTLRTIGATTFAEYKRYIEKDPAPTRRFQSIQVDEPSEAKALLIVSTLKGAQGRSAGLRRRRRGRRPDDRRDPHQHHEGGGSKAG
jgi:ATP-dependent Clp protease ATP-binding subunit ClpA